MTTQNENTSAGTEALSGQRSELCASEYTTLGDDSQLATLQHRIGHIRLKARVPGQLIALRVMPPAMAALLTIDEARQLIGALASLIGDIEADARAHGWSRRKLEQIIAQADASTESYHSKL